MIAVAPVRSAILLIGHGTRDAAGTRQFFELAERTQTLVGEDISVRPCLLEFQSPTIDEAWASMIADRIERVAISPLLLFAAGHAKSDIPEAIEAAAAEHGEIDAVSWCRPLSRHPSMVDLVRDRIIETFDCLKNPAGRRVVVMVGRGSHDPCATSDMRVLAEAALFGQTDAGSLASRLNLHRGDQFTAFYAMAQPAWLDVLQTVAQESPAAIVVYPHLLFSGRLLQAIEDGVAELRNEFPSIQWRVSRPIGPVSGLAHAIADRATVGDHLWA